jgi:hypothetical protein
MSIVGKEVAWHWRATMRCRRAVPFNSVNYYVPRRHRHGTTRRVIVELRLVRLPRSADDDEAKSEFIDDPGLGDDDLAASQSDFAVAGHP